MKKNKDKIKNCRLGKVGGEAVLEGVMMRGTERYSVAVRREDGSVSVTTNPSVSLRKKHKILNIPILRGIIGMVESMVLSFKVLNISAEAFGAEEEEPTKFEKWLDRHFGKTLIDIVMVIGSVLGVALAIGLFVFLPSLFTKLINNAAGNNLGWTRNLIEGFIKIAIFIGYLKAVSLMKDIRRTFEFHGAEHKSIFCYEAGEELTPENAAKYKRFHPRCGTSFLFIALVISILIFSLPFVPWDNIWLRMLIKLPLIPLVVGVGFEFLMLTGKHDNALTRALAMPGMWMQRITTREPDAAQLEIAIIALKNALIDEFPDAEEQVAAINAQVEAEKEADAEANESNEADGTDAGSPDIADDTPASATDNAAADTTSEDGKA